MGRHYQKAIPMRPAYDEFTPKMIEDIKKIIEGGGGSA